MLVVFSLTTSSGIDFTNILCAAFLHADSKSAKRNNDTTVIFAILRFAHVKALCKTLVKLTPEEQRQIFTHTEGLCVVASHHHDCIYKGVPS